MICLSNKEASQPHRSVTGLRPQADAGAWLVLQGPTRLSSLRARFNYPERLRDFFSICYLYVLVTHK